METNVRLPNMHNILPDVASSPQGLQQNLSLEIEPIDNAEPCCPRENSVGSHLPDECMKLILPIVCDKRVHLVTDWADLFTDHRMSGLPIRAMYMHFQDTV